MKRLKWCCRENAAGALYKIIRREKLVNVCQNYGRIEMSSVGVLYECYRITGYLTPERQKSLYGDKTVSKKLNHVWQFTLLWFDDFVTENSSWNVAASGFIRLCSSRIKLSTSERQRCLTRPSRLSLSSTTTSTNRNSSTPCRGSVPVSFANWSSLWLCVSFQLFIYVIWTSYISTQ